MSTQAITAEFVNLPNGRIAAVATAQATGAHERIALNFTNLGKRGTGTILRFYGASYAVYGTAADARLVTPYIAITPSSLGLILSPPLSFKPEAHVTPLYDGIWFSFGSELNPIDVYYDGRTTAGNIAVGNEFLYFLQGDKTTTLNDYIQIVAYMEIITTSDSTGVVVTDATPTYQGSDSTGAIAIKIVRSFRIPTVLVPAALLYNQQQLALSGQRVVTPVGGGAYEAIIGAIVPLSDCMGIFGRGAGSIVESGDAVYVTEEQKPYYAPGLWSWLVSREHR